jgi:hypothetical protein
MEQNRNWYYDFGGVSGPLVGITDTMKPTPQRFRFFVDMGEMIVGFPITLDGISRIVKVLNEVLEACTPTEFSDT